MNGSVREPAALCTSNWKNYVLKHCKTQEYWHRKLGLKGPSSEPGSIYYGVNGLTVYARPWENTKQMPQRRTK